jgi:hypothetical protein
LQWLMSNLELTGKHARWALELQEYDFTIRHQVGVTYQNADVPSRYLQASDLNLTGARLDIVPAMLKIALSTVGTSPTENWEESARWSVTMQTLHQQDEHLATDDAPQGIRTQDALRHAKCLHQIEHALLRQPVSVASTVKFPEPPRGSSSTLKAEKWHVTSFA